MEQIDGITMADNKNIHNQVNSIHDEELDQVSAGLVNLVEKAHNLNMDS